MLSPYLCLGLPRRFGFLHWKRGSSQYSVNVSFSACLVTVAYWNAASELQTLARSEESVADEPVSFLSQ
jgi:uncharacterized protein (DUF2461 family)